MTQEMMEDAAIGADSIRQYITAKLNEAFSNKFEQYLQIDEYETLYGKGAYEDFIFKGGAGL